MGRVTPNEDGEMWDYIRWAGASKKAFNGKPGQAVLKEIEKALLAMPTQRLIQDKWVYADDVCVLGALDVYRTTQEKNISWGTARHIIIQEGFDTEDWDIAKKRLNITRTLAWELMYENDGDYYTKNITPEQRWTMMLRYIRSKINY